MANDMLRRRREATASPSGSGLPMTRAELAEAVNQYVWKTTGESVCLDAETLARIAQGLRSRRVTDRMANLARQVAAYRGIPSVDEFLERAREYASVPGRQ
ncbi:hypothetical protein [Antribacter gilvus]|uniref:hypothetical protein n=1 Tax=Antribacter gilvus TaxID=2304675 RepID=UPI000F786893|nr:hypothetical protein [Antribacter gilvus]